MKEHRKVYGIDLGTTYSCIATIDENDQPILLRNEMGGYHTPSVVFYENDNSKRII